MHRAQYQFLCKNLSKHAASPNWANSKVLDFGQSTTLLLALIAASSKELGNKSIKVSGS